MRLSAWLMSSVIVVGAASGCDLGVIHANTPAFGGIMFWELSEDVEGEHSLYRAIQDSM